MKKPKTYEEAIAQLEEILDKIADQTTPLEETIKLYAQAAALMEICSQKLHSAELEMEQIQQKISQTETTDIIQEGQ